MSPILVLAALCSCAQAGKWPELTTQFGRLGSVSRDGSYRIDAPRRDLQVQSATGMLLPAEMGLRSTAVLTGSTSGCSAEGEICVVQEEINPVIDDLREDGLEVVSLGSRLAGEQPSVYFIGFRAQGGALRIGSAIKASLSELGKDRIVSTGLNRTGKVPVVDWKVVSLALGLDVSPSGESGVMRASAGSSWVCFGGCPCGRTMVTGLVETDRSKLQMLIDTLRRGKFSLGSISGSDPVWIAFEGEGEAVQLASSMRDIYAGK